MQVVILAGGSGTRLRPLTYRMPKVMIPVKSKPFLGYLLELVRSQGIQDIVICIGYLGEHIREYFGNGVTWGLRIRYSLESKPLGTGGAIRNAESYLSDTFILLNGDTYLPIDYSLMWSSFSQKQTKLGMIAIYKDPTKIIHPNIAINNNGLVIDYDKKKVKKEMEYTDAGSQIFRKEIIDLIPKHTFLSLEEKIFPFLIARQTLVGYVTNQKFLDIGTHEGLRNIEEYVE